VNRANSLYWCWRLILHGLMHVGQQITRCASWRGCRPTWRGVCLAQPTPRFQRVCWMPLRYRRCTLTNSCASVKLADIVAQRVAMLAPNARYTLQALAVLGDRVSPSLLSEFLPKAENVTDALAILEHRGMIWSAGDLLSIDHPLLRDVILAGIPAAARRELHGRALLIMTRLGAPLEARAQTAYLAEDTFDALLLLEQVADRSATRNDTAGEIFALRRGLELARHEIARGELDDPMRAVVIFGRKLGAALTRAGDYSDAEGVLREALDYVGPSNSEYARLLGALALVARGRERNSESRAQLDAAIEAARRSGDRDLEAAFTNTRRSWFP
jgi:predicted ATPase